MRYLLALLQRLIAAPPDTITAGVFLTAWVTPQGFGPKYVRNLSILALAKFSMGGAGEAARGARSEPEKSARAPDAPYERGEA